MKKIKGKSAETIQKIAKKVVSTTVGKSFPIWMYESEIPVEVQKWMKEQSKCEEVSPMDKMR